MESLGAASERTNRASVVANALRRADQNFSACADHLLNSHANDSITPNTGQWAKSTRLQQETQ